MKIKSEKVKNDHIHLKNDHIHLIDKDTGEIFDVDLENIASHLPIPEGFKMQDYDINIYGKFRN